MKKHLLRSMLLAVLMIFGTMSTWAAGYTRTLTDALEVPGYTLKAFYDFQNNNPEVLPTSGDLRYRDGGIWGLHNFGSGTRSGSATISVAEGDILVVQHYSDVVSTINCGTLNAGLTSSVGYQVYDITSTAGSITFTIARYGGLVAALVMEKDASATTADYTLNYNYNGNPVKTVNGTGVIGTPVATEASFFVDDVKYFRADGEPESFTIAASGNTFNVNVRLAATYNYSLSDNFGATVTSGSGLEGEKVYAPYPRYQLKDGAFYEAAVTNKEYRKEITLSGDNISATVEYAVKEGANAVFFVEGESIDGITQSTYGNIAVRASNALAGISTEDLTITTLPAGKYKFHAGIFTSKSSYAEKTVNFGIGEQTFAAGFTGVNLNEVASDEFTLNAATEIKYLGTTSWSDAQLDYLWIEKTGNIAITATFVNGAKWDAVFAYTFNPELNGAWPGQQIEKTGTKTINEVEYDVYTYSVDSNVVPGKIIFHNDGGTQTADLDFEIGKEYSYGLPNVEEKMDYYIVGNMTEWGPKAEYKMALNEGAETEEYVIKLNLTTTSQFKVAKSNGSTIADDAWYPTGMGNNYGENGEITVDGEYTIYFRPNADGGDDWFYKYIYAVAPSAEVDMTNLIVNADLMGEDGWDATGTKGMDGSGIVKVGSAADFNFKQTIALPAGKYKVTAQAAYRYGGGDQAEQDEYDAIQAGTPTKFVQLYATVGAKTVATPVQNRWDGASDTDLAGSGAVVVNGKYVPNSSDAVKAWFAAGKYVNEAEFNVPADGNVTIGINRTGTPASDYTVIGPWTLTRIGDAEAEPDPDVPAPGTDMTDKIVNPSFETGDLTGWTVGSSSDTGVRENSNATYATEGCDGAYLFNTWWQGIPITQTIADLPNGKYELKALMASDAGDHLYLLGNGEHSAVFGSPNKGVFVEQSMQFYVTNHTATIGAIGGNEDGSFTEAGYFWYKVDNFRLTFVEALPNIADVELPEGKMSNAAAQAMADAKESGDLVALLDAIAKAKESIEAYAHAKKIIDNFENPADKTNVYTAEAKEAFDTFFAPIQANINALNEKYEAGTLTDEEAKAAADPMVFGWHADNQFDDFLLSAWSIGESKAKDYDTALYINGWSTEGNNDGTNFFVPFFEYWTGDGESLAANTLSATLTNVPEGEYTVSAWVRVRMKNGAEAPATGITLQANEGEAVNVTGDQVGTSQFFLKEVTATGTVGSDGVLKIKFNVAADNNISWISFKNVMYTKKAETNYYIVGNMTDWAVSEDYKMTLNTSAEATEYMFTTNLTTTSQFKVVKVEGETQTWIPDGMGNAYGENGEITEDGSYTIYFRPNADGGSDWFHNVIYVAKNITDGINKLQMEALKGNVYNLNGQKVTKVQKGLYIVNGKKAIKK